MSDNITLPREVAEKALRRAFYLGQNYWRDADSDSRAAHKRADKHLQDFDAVCSDVLTRTHIAEQPKPKQEPVAWHYQNNGGASVMHWGTSARLDADMQAAKDYPNTHKVTPLYTFPPDTEALRRENERLREALNRFEYSSDGHIKRYPEEEEVIAALRREV